MRFADAADYLESLDRVGTQQHTRDYHFEHGIARARALLSRLGGAPHATTRCVIVTGSKGKGSTVAMISSIVACAGRAVGAFTGPHLHTPLERFRVFGACASPALMSEREFVAYAERIRAIVETWDAAAIGAPTRFEAYTAMAYRWFEERGVDLAVMEVGIGGRLDAVNLGSPMVSVFTNISLEHTQMLGATIADIACEKAGIMRAGGTAVIAEQTREAADVLVDHARHIGSAYEFAESRWHCRPLGHEISPRCLGQWFEVNADDAQPGHPAPYFVPLLGKYQLQNAAVALACANALNARDLDARGFDVSDDAVRRGFANVEWRGRFDVLGFEPLVIADGAHTPYSMQQLAESLAEYFQGRAIHFVIGALRDKDTRGILRAAACIATSMTLTQPDHRRSISATALLEQLRAEPCAAEPSVAVRESVDDAIAHARSLAAPDDVICITGSLHLVAEAERAARADGVLARDAQAV